MAQLSPGVEVIERDASLRIETVTSSTGAIVVHSTKGPVNKLVNVTSVSDYVDVFGLPDDVNYKFWWTASKFLEASNQLMVVRIEDKLKDCAGVSVGFKTPSTTAAQNGEQRIINDLYAAPSPKKVASYPLSYESLYEDSVLNLGTNTDPNYTADDRAYLGEADAPLGGIAVSGSSEFFHIYAVGAGPYYNNISFSVVSAIEYNTLQNLKLELAQATVQYNSAYVSETATPFENPGVQQIIAKYWSGVPADTNHAWDTDPWDTTPWAGGTRSVTASTALLSRVPLLRQEIIISQPMLSDGITVDTANLSAGWEIDSGLLSTYTSPEYGPQPTITGYDPLDGTAILKYDEYLLFIWNEKGNADSIYLLSTDPDKKDFQGNSMFGPKVVNGNNKYVYLFTEESEYASVGLEIKWSIGKTNLMGADGLTGYTSAKFAYPSSSGGVVDNAGLGTLDGEIMTAWVEQFSNKELVEVDLLLDCDYSDNVKRTIDDLARNIRKDCMAILNVPESVIMNTTTKKVVDQVYSKLKTYMDTTLKINSSYSAIYGNYFKIFDPYEEKERWVPATGWIGATIARVDFAYAQWWAPAGLNRGLLTNIVDIALNPTKAQRDILYVNRINPIVNFLGQGIVIWGQKTMQAKPSAFDRINVRRLFLYLERSIEKMARYFIFELNDETTRTRFRSIVNGFLAEIKAKRGVYDFLVVADASNNTADVIDRNEFVAEILIKPARVIEFIKLIFTAVGTGTDFAELVGKGYNNKENP